MIIEQQATEAVVTKVATAAQYGGAGGAIFFGLKANEFAALCGVLIAAAGFLINWYYKHQHLKLAREGRAAQPPVGDDG